VADGEPQIVARYCDGTTWYRTPAEGWSRIRRAPADLKLAAASLSLKAVGHRFGSAVSQSGVELARAVAKSIAGARMAQAFGARPRLLSKRPSGRIVLGSISKRRRLLANGTELLLLPWTGSTAGLFSIPTCPAASVRAR
jgi:hypothetical protein